jgi:hypothetical protein
MKKNKIIECIKNLQQADGGFLGYVSESGNDFQPEKADSSVAVTAQILDILNSIEDGGDLKKIKQKAAEYILLNKSGDYSFSVLDSMYNNRRIFSSDLNTTFLALYSLSEFNAELIDGKVIAKLLMILTSSEVVEGGPYYSFVDKSYNNSVDIGVNIQIFRFLQRQGVDLPELNNFIERKIEDDEMGSSFYVEDIKNIYDLSKFPVKIKNVKTTIDDIDLNKIKAFFKYVHPESKKVTYIGSDAIGLALSLNEKGNASKTSRKYVVSSSDEENFYLNITKKAEERFDGLGQELKKYANSTLRKIISFDRDRQIAMLSYYFRESVECDRECISDKIIIDLGAANIYIWMAYTIYDDFLDNEGDPKMLSVANVCLREFTAIYKNIIKDNADFALVFDRVMDTLDSANAWEVANCRALVVDSIFYIPEVMPDYGDFSKLAERSLAHALGPIAILHIIGYKGVQADVNNLLDFFKHYLVARQLNDDAHDWEEDLRNGHIDSVVSEILKKVKNLKTLNIENDIKKLQKDFWFEIISEISEKVIENIEISKKYLKKVQIVKNKGLLEQFLNTTENSAKTAIKEQKQAMDFLKTYK